MTDKIKDIKEAKEMLIDAFKGKLAQGVESMDAEEAGAVTDMIKDLAEAEKECWEAAYYKSIVEAMKKSEEGEGRMGYDPWRYSDGRYAPTGRGSRSGYMPPYYETDGMEVMGYTPDTYSNGSNGSRSYSGNNRMGYEGDPMDELARLWQEADHDTKRRMKGALEEMARSLDA